MTDINGIINNPFIVNNKLINREANDEFITKYSSAPVYEKLGVKHPLINFNLNGNSNVTTTNDNYEQLQELNIRNKLKRPHKFKLDDPFLIDKDIRNNSNSNFNKFNYTDNYKIEIMTAKEILQNLDDSSLDEQNREEKEVPIKIIIAKEIQQNRLPSKIQQNLDDSSLDEQNREEKEVAIKIIIAKEIHQNRLPSKIRTR